MEDLTPIIKSYSGSMKRLFALDYDGTLIDFAPTPSLAVPDQVLLGILSRLSEDRRNTVAIISGRDHESLQNWFGHLPIHLFAEHGALARPASHSEWLRQVTDSGNWKAPYRELMTSYVALVPGSLIEEKQTGLNFHYRLATDQDRAEKRAAELQEEVITLADAAQLNIILADKALEVRQSSIDKGTVVTQLLDQQAFDFTMAAGNSPTDEDMFAALPSTSWTFRIGTDGASSLARQHIPNPAAFKNLLTKLIS